MHRHVFPLLLLTASLGLSGAAQTAVPPAQAAAPASAAEPVSPQLAAAESLIATSDWKGAEIKLAAYLVAHPNDARALFDAGYVADQQQKDGDASAYYSRAVQANPKSFEARLAYGLLLARQGRLDDAQPQLEAATSLDPGEAGPALKARAWRALAQIDRRTDPAKASADLLEALKISPETPRDTLLAAELAEQSGQTDAAEAAYRRVLAKDPKSAEAQAGLAQILIKKKQYPEAEQLLRSAMQQAPNDPGLDAELVTALAAQNKPEALPLLQKLHAAHADDENITRMLADALSGARETAAADQLYTSLLASHPHDPDLLIAHGENLVLQQKFADAFDIFTKATELAPANPDGWSGLAFAASKTGRPSITLHALTMRSRYLPESASTYFLWATSYDSLHDRKAAITFYHHFLEAAAGKFPDQEWQARQRLLELEKKH